MKCSNLDPDETSNYGMKFVDSS